MRYAIMPNTAENIHCLLKDYILMNKLSNQLQFTIHFGLYNQKIDHERLKINLRRVNRTEKQA